MGILQNLLGLFKPRKQTQRYYPLVVKCRRCGEVIHGQVDLLNEPSIQYDEKGKTSYFCRKVLMSDSGRCFQNIEIELTFDANRMLKERKITGGEFIGET